MKQWRVAIYVLAVISCCMILSVYYWHRTSGTPMHFKKSLPYMKNKPEQLHDPNMLMEPLRIVGTPLRHVPLDEVYPDGNRDDKSLEDELYSLPTFINTPGCQIPVAMIPFKEFITNEGSKRPGTCGKREVFLEKVSSNEIQAMIKLKRTFPFECCVRFILRSNVDGVETTKIRYTQCQKFDDGAKITLQSDFVNVKCFEKGRNTSRQVYDDAYAFTKMINITKNSSKPCKHKYNVLMLGMDSMSLSRFTQVMKRTTQYFSENFWLGFRAYHKIGDNTIPNLMAVLTGQNSSMINKTCYDKMDECKEWFIWKKFEDIGYVTAYAEDNILLPDTFHDSFAFKKPPTHHYLRPLYLKGETKQNSVLCVGKKPSGQHLLDYAFDFALTYREQSFFGLFWMNSYSHDEKSRPEDADNMIESFFNRLTYTGVLENTFVIFFSDHGIRFGKYRMPVESYYDNRMPCLFIRSPLYFSAVQTPLFMPLKLNQDRLVTPYDVYNTLVDIHSISICNRPLNNTIITSVAEGCPKCHSLFNFVSPNRTCQDAAIDKVWCSCHKLYPLDIEDTDASKSVNLIVSQIRNMSRISKAKRCWSCMELELKKVIRIHFYYDDDKIDLYHVVALSMTPGNLSYEGVVLRRGGRAKLVGSINLISPYRGMGRCVGKPSHLFCVCRKFKVCN